LETIDFITIITIAFLGSFGHCVGMCGGIVIAYSSTKIDNTWSKINQAFSHIVYSAGRVLTYALLGAMFGYLGGVATFDNTSNGVLLLIAGSFMILAGFSLIGKISFLNSIEHSISSTKWYQELFRDQLQKESKISFFILGMLNGLLPCGFVYFFAITAASTADPLWGALVMIVFGLSTIPAMFSLGFFVGVLKKTEFRGILIKVASLSVIVYGLFTLYNGYEYIINPTKTLLDCHK